MTERMCSTTGIGCAKNRAFAGVTSAPPASCASLAVPAIAGTRLNRISSVGIHHSDRRERRRRSSWSARDEAEAGHHDDIVAGARRAAAAQRLESGHVVARLETHANSADAELTSDAAVRREIVRRVDVELAIVVAPSARAGSRERNERDRLAR